METVMHWSHGVSMNKRIGADVLDPDVRLMLLFKDGDTGAFEQLFSRHMHAIVNFAYRFVRNREMAEELAQDIFLKVYEGGGRYQPQARFTTWLYRIATNTCLNEVRKPHFRVVHETLTPTERDDPDAKPIDPREKGSAAPDKILERQAVARVLRRALDTLPEKQRTAFILSKYQEFSYAEVAEIMRISEKAVKSLIHRAKETLAERLEPLLPELLKQ